MFEKILQREIKDNNKNHHILSKESLFKNK